MTDRGRREENLPPAGALWRQAWTCRVLLLRAGLWRQTLVDSCRHLRGRSIASLVDALTFLWGIVGRLPGLANCLEVTDELIKAVSQSSTHSGLHLRQGLAVKPCRDSGGGCLLELRTQLGKGLVVDGPVATFVGQHFPLQAASVRDFPRDGNHRLKR